MVRSVATTRAYDADWRHFDAWCAARSARALPASSATVVAYVDDSIAHRRLATVRRRVAAVRARHVDGGHRSPTATPRVRAALARAEWYGRDDRRDTVPLGTEELRAVSRSAPDSLAGRRDRAIVLVGCGAGLAPGEIARLEVADVRLVAAGLRVDAPRGRVVVPFGSARALCAVRAWREWIEASGIVRGAAFRAVDRHARLGAAALTPRSVTRIVQRACERAGLDGARYSARSLRRGMVLAATERGAGARRIMAHTGHRSARLVRRYMADGTRSSIDPARAD